MMLRGEQTELQLLWFARGGVWNSKYIETYSVRIIIVEVLLYTHCNFK